MHALSILQPWAFAILQCGKRVENRSWYTEHRGELLLHASKRLRKWECARALASIEDICPGAQERWPGIDAIERGGIVGIARLVGCRLNRENDAKGSPWEFPGEFGWILEDVRPLPFVPCKGALGLWDVPEDVLEKLGAREGGVMKERHGDHRP